MRLSPNGLILSATDLASFLGCRHRTALDMAVARDALKKPRAYREPLLELLSERGLEHERRYVESLREKGLHVVALNHQPWSEDRTEVIAQTMDAMRAGVDVIVQGALGDARWFGLPDVLERVARPSGLGSWSYEVVDTKLARETKAGTILQLCLYSELVAAVQDIAPEHFHVVTPDPAAPRESYRFDDFAAYYRMVRDRLIETSLRHHNAVAAEHYPEPVDLCDVCRWASRCAERRRDDDHLSLVAGITRLQRRELGRRGVTTLAALAKLDLPIPFDPDRGSRDGYVRVREQARLQLESRGLTRPRFELLGPEPGSGLSRLPAPSPGDVFLDLEGDPFAREGGREYLFGVVTIAADGSPRYQRFWAFDDAQERRAFEELMELIIRAWDQHEGMHVYHYAPYEPAALKRLMGRHATRMGELDRLLRGERFVDLYGVIRQAMRVGVERYSIKCLEPLYGFTRAVELSQANHCLRAMETALWRNAVDLLPDEVRAGVEGYNQDDCISTLRLRDWLEEQRAELIARGVDIPRPVPADDAPSPETDERAARVEALRRQLLEGVPETPDKRDDEQQARWLLAFLLDWHRREDRVAWWEYFRLRELPEEELVDEPQAVAGLEHLERVFVKRHKKSGKPTGTVVDRYRYPPQEMEIDAGDELKLQNGAPFGEVVAVDRDARTMDIRKGRGVAETHPSAAFAHRYFNPKEMERSLFEIGERVAGEGSMTLGPEAPDGAGRTLLRAAPPRLTPGPFAGSQSDVEAATRTVLDLDRSLLAVQGPPGAGKTYCGARMICALVQAGKTVGVTATSHKVISNLLRAVREAAAEAGIAVRRGHRAPTDGVLDEGVTLLPTNDAVLESLQRKELDVVGGTSWLWARADMAGSVDVLFVDEAGQMSLANAVAVSPAAASLVLLGDPQQLEQPRKGTHPDGVDRSALQHFLGDHRTMPVERGMFLPLTWRLAPPICVYTSELFYEGKLRPLDGLERQGLTDRDGQPTSGLRIVPVEHDGNRNHAEEEIDAVERLVGWLLGSGIRYTDREGVSQPLTASQILVVAPYNAQVSRLDDRLARHGVAVGTVDRFQGQEAPVVIYSMTTSRPDDAPRGMGFLYSLNRSNVATSRARAAVILVLSPRLFEPECRSPAQMRLANALCRYRELAAVLSAPAGTGSGARAAAPN